MLLFMAEAMNASIIKIMNMAEGQDRISLELDIQEAIKLITTLLRDLINDDGKSGESMFDSEKVPQIKIDSYLKRVHKFTKYSPQCLFLAVIYFDRYNLHEGSFSLTWYNVHRFFLACLIIAVKYHDDIYFDNLAFEKAGGVPAAQLLCFELEIFSKLGFRAHVEGQEFQSLVENIVSVYGKK